MAPELEKAFIHAHRDSIVRFWERVRLRILDWKSKYEWPPGTPVEAALNRRTHIEAMLKNDLAARNGCLSKGAFDSVIRGGFGTGSKCSEEEIKGATQPAFELLKGAGSPTLRAS